MDISIDHLDLHDLRVLNQKVVERVKYLRHMETNNCMQKFNLNQMVCFEASNNEMLTGKITKFNKKTVSVCCDDGGHYNVSPQLLEKVVVTEKVEKKEIIDLTPEHMQKLKQMLSADMKSLFKNHSRNAPCPCGSGKKFKRCCLQ